VGLADAESLISFSVSVFLPLSLEYCGDLISLPFILVRGRFG